MPEAENTQDLEPQGGVTDGVQAQQETQPQEQEIPSNEGAEPAAAQPAHRREVKAWTF